MNSVVSFRHPLDAHTLHLRPIPPTSTFLFRANSGGQLFHFSSGRWTTDHQAGAIADKSSTGADYCDGAFIQTAYEKIGLQIESHHILSRLTATPRLQL